MPQMKGLKDLKLPVGQRKKKSRYDGSRAYDIGTRPSYLLILLLLETMVSFLFLENFNANKQPI
jgi:hypothetical protein